MATAVHSFAPRVSFSAPVLHAVHRLADALVEHLVTRPRLAQELYAYSDYELADMRLTRSDIPNILSGRQI